MYTSVCPLLYYTVGQIYKLTGLVCLTFIDLSMYTFDSPKENIYFTLINDVKMYLKYLSIEIYIYIIFM